VKQEQSENVPDDIANFYQVTIFLEAFRCFTLNVGLKPFKQVLGIWGNV
jgi:hypothetical protein